MEIGNNNVRAFSDEFHNSIARDVRVGYVMRHFWQAYEARPEQYVTISIGGRYPQAPVQIDDNSQGFFEAEAPFPSPPVWRQWQDRQIPFFFGPSVNQPVLELLPEKQAIIHTDLISAAFYLLSGWQEFYSKERDQHGRFPYAASVQHQYGFVAIPVVNYYFDVLKTAIEHVTGQPLRLRRWAGGRAWAAFITHDIDNLYSAWKAPAKAALQRRDWLDFARRYWRHLTQKDAWDNLAEVQQTVAEYGAKSTFFFLPDHRKAANGTPNADYKINQPRLVKQIRALYESGAEIAVHGSLNSDSTSLVLQAGSVQEIVGLLSDSRAFFGNRFHYLQWSPSVTPLIVDSVPVHYDSTLGFAEHYGFRNSYCRPFYPYNFVHGGYCRFLEIPLNVMDATLHHPKYLQLAPEEILSALTPMFQEIERFGGVCTVLWHNENFDPANTRNGPSEFRALMEYLRTRNVAFVNGSDICQSFQPLSS